MISRSSIDSVLNVAAIDEVVGDYLTLKKRGSNLIGLCPFHNERTPSFTVSPAKGMYKCFGCGKGGNAVSFLMEHDSLSFVEAIRRLAGKYNIELEEDGIFDKSLYDENRKHIESIYIVLDFACRYFIKLLNESAEGQEIGKTYFSERGYTEQTITTFQLGFSSRERDGLVRSSQENGYNTELMVQAGLIKMPEGYDRYVDLFRDRVIFPIHDLNGKVIAFAGRQLQKNDKSPKYLNSPETDVYHKSDVLYGLYFAKKEIKKQDNCYLVEGYTDVITLYQSGIENVVASSGTSLTEGQIRLIKRFTPNITVLFDGDEAGIKASMRGIDLILEQGMNVKVVMFPDNQDPDSYCRKTGGDAFIQFLHTNAVDFIVFKTRLLLEEGVMHDPVKKSAVIRNILESIGKIPDSLIRSAFVSECSRLLDVDEKLLLLELVKIRKKENQFAIKQIDRQINEVVRKDMVSFNSAFKIGEENENALVRLLIQSGNRQLTEGATVAEFIFKELQDDTGLEIEHEPYKTVVVSLIQVMQENLNIDESFFIHHEDESIRNLTAGILTDRYELSPGWQENGIHVQTIADNYIRDTKSVWMFLKLYKLNALIQENLTALQTETEEMQKFELFQYHKDLIEIRNQIASVLGTVYS